MKGTESGNRAVVGHRRIFEKIHEVDVSAAGGFNISACVSTIHISVKENLQHLTRRGLIFPDAGISLIQRLQVHVFNIQT